MAVKAYVLMNFVSSSVPETLNEVRALKGVNFADAVTGPYDAIAQVEIADMDSLGGLVTHKILKVKGVAKTLTCVSV